MSLSTIEEVFDDRSVHALPSATTRALSPAQREALARVLPPIGRTSAEARRATETQPAATADDLLSATSMRYMPIVVPMLAVFLCACIAVIWMFV